ncbi:hypothetical protein KFL_001280300 [Klebsormidium nitens]|uniref:Uncharacterized protein n=1 Tax=Klebsormidium nitens TaxID=105231 RepID=A0A1Y1I0F0_KLENI|nr:hypothetical protein KFL_001280300 [Klebsormidium nitens]|eukprot:GAQ82909.1 hypothetical protein KFL_001280300 [Klebsormidium nitens]
MPAARDDILKALQKGPIAVVDPAIGRLKSAESIFPKGISDNRSLQCVNVGLYEGVNQYLCHNASSNKKLRKIKWSDLVPGASRAQSLKQKGLWEALDFFLTLLAANRALCTAVKAYLDAFFVNPGTAACNTATRARLEACFAHMLAAASPEPAADVMPPAASTQPPAANANPNMSNGDTIASLDLLHLDPSLIADLPDLEDPDEQDFEDMLRLFGVEAARDQA